MLRPSLVKCSASAGFASAARMHTAAMCRSRSARDFRNLSRAGTLKNRSRTSTACPARCRLGHAQRRCRPRSDRASPSAPARCARDQREARRPTRSTAAPRRGIRAWRSLAGRRSCAACWWRGARTRAAASSARHAAAVVDDADQARHRPPRSRCRSASRPASIAFSTSSLTTRRGPLDDFAGRDLVGQRVVEHADRPAMVGKLHDDSFGDPRGNTLESKHDLNALDLGFVDCTTRFTIFASSPR